MKLGFFVELIRALIEKGSCRFKKLSSNSHFFRSMKVNFFSLFFFLV